MTNLFLFIVDHWGAISSGVSGWVMATYLHIKQAGGLRTIWSNILGPKPAQGGSATKTENT